MALAGVVLGLLVVGIAIVVVAAVAGVYRWILLAKYLKLNKKTNSADVTSVDAARAVLDANGMQDVKVEKAGFFRWLLFGNHYSVRKKTIFLRGNIYNKKTVTALGVSLQKVGLAIQHKNNEKGFKTRYALQILSLWSPFIFYGIALAGVVIDFCTNFTGLSSLIGLSIGLVYYIAVFFCLLFTIKVEKKANRQALYMIKQANLLSEEELDELAKLFDTYITIDILDFVVSILKIIYYVLKILMQALARKGSK